MRYFQLFSLLNGASDKFNQLKKLFIKSWRREAYTLMQPFYSSSAAASIAGADVSFMTA
jgi:hypothetical protein